MDPIFVTLAIFFGIIVLSIIFVNPLFGLYLFTILLYLKPGIFESVHVERIIGALTLIVLFFHAEKKSGIKYFNDVQSKWLIALGVVMCLSMLTSIWRSNTVGFLLDFTKVYIAYFLIINLISSLKEYRAIVWAMLISMLYIGLLSIRNYYLSGGAFAGERMFGASTGALFGDPNDMAMGFIMLLPFLYYDLFRGTSILRKATLLVIMGIFLCCIVLTQSRGGLIGMGAMLFILWLRSRNKVGLAIIGILVLVLGWQIAPQSFKDRMMTIQTASKEDNAAISRLNAWKAGLNMMTHRVCGVGVGNFGEGFVTYRPPDAVDAPGVRRVAHNMFMQVAGETGIAGLIVFLFMIGSSLVSLNRAKKIILKVEKTKKENGKEIALLADATFLSLIGYCASGIFLAQAYNFVLFYLIGFSVVLKRLAFSDLNTERIKVKKI